MCVIVSLVFIIRKILLFSSSSLRGQPLERDVFNLRKLLVATSLDGTVFGLDNSDGSVVWRMYLGDRVAGLVTVTGEEKVRYLETKETVC